MKYPSKVNIYNLASFFNFKTISSSQIYPGSLIQFNYRSPEGVHDKKPLVYVLEVEGDRIWGVNLHYKFFLLSNLIQDKIKLVESINKSASTSPDPTPGELNKPHIPSLIEIKRELNNKPISSPPSISPQLLEKYQLSPIPSDILRNYLYTRISGLQKLVFKI